VSICLAMIVRDEQEVIARCLRSVREHIDQWVICDTGSCDDTRAIIRAELAGIPGELHDRQWVNFGHNRSELLRLARNSADYLLLLDADMTVTVAELPSLEADAYMLRVNEDPEYWLKCLVRGEIEWFSKGATHEYLACEQPHTVENLREIVISHHHDGSSRAHKFTRDLELLSTELEANPGDQRTTFYLAQTCRDLGETERALELYERRVRMGGWEEEVFYSLHQAALLRCALDGWPAATSAFLAAWSYRPSRVEPLYELASRLRLAEQYHAAHLFAKQGIGIRRPADHLFVQRWMYEWGLLFEYSITAYWTGDVHAALRACDRLLELQLPVAYRRQTLENRSHCLRALHGQRAAKRELLPTLTLDEQTGVVSARLA
jgi:tetratricopeptide (TPR) repeat protein